MLIRHALNRLFSAYYAGGGGSTWILATGLWADTGVWDDSAAWID